MSELDSRVFVPNKGQFFSGDTFMVTFEMFHSESMWNGIMICDAFAQVWLLQKTATHVSEIQAHGPSYQLSVSSNQEMAYEDVNNAV